MVVAATRTATRVRMATVEAEAATDPNVGAPIASIALADIQSSCFLAVDHDEVVNHATEHGSGDRSLFSQAMGYVNSNKVISVYVSLKVDI